MVLPAREAPSFVERLRTSVRLEPYEFHTLRLNRHANVYTCGDLDDKVYLIEHGQIKLTFFTPAGKECLLAIYTEGDIFGESCSAGVPRAETARVMRPTVLRQIPWATLLGYLTQRGLQEGFVRYLAERLTEQKQVIADLLTADSEHRLAATLIRLGRKLGKQDPRGLRIEERFTQEELSEMVGTTRSRVGYFLKRFRDLGLIETTPESFLILKEEDFTCYLEAPPRLHAA